MEDTEPMVYLAYLTFAILFIMIGFRVMQGAVDSAMNHHDMEATGLNVGMAKNFHLMNQGDRFGEFESGNLQDDLKADEACRIDIEGYIEDKPMHKVDDSCNYFEDNERTYRGYRTRGGYRVSPEPSEPRLSAYAVVDGEPRIFSAMIPDEVFEYPGGGSE